MGTQRAFVANNLNGEIKQATYPSNLVANYDYGGSGCAGHEQSRRQ